MTEDIISMNLRTKIHTTEITFHYRLTGKKHTTVSLCENETVRVDETMAACQLKLKFTAQSRSRSRSQLLDMLDRFANVFDIEPSQEVHSIIDHFLFSYQCL